MFFSIEFVVVPLAEECLWPVFSKADQGQNKKIVCIFFSSFSHKILVGRSGKLFKNFLLFKKTFSVGQSLGRSVGRENLLLLKNHIWSGEISVGRSVEKTFLKLF